MSATATAVNAAIQTDLGGTNPGSRRFDAGGGSGRVAMGAGGGGGGGKLGLLNAAEVWRMDVAA